MSIDLTLKYFLKIGKDEYNKVLNNYDKAFEKYEVDDKLIPIDSSGYFKYAKSLLWQNNRNIQKLIGFYLYITQNLESIKNEDWFKLEKFIHIHQEDAVQVKDIAQNYRINHYVKMPYDFFSHLLSAREELFKKSSNNNMEGGSQPKKRGRPKGSKNKKKSITKSQLKTSLNKSLKVKVKKDLRKTATPEKKQWRKNTIQKLKKSKQAARRKYGTINCPKGTIMREGYIRKAYIRKNGTRVAKKIVPPSCIKKRGAKDKYKVPRGKSGIGPLKKGELSKHGYSGVKELGVRKRRKALVGAIDEYGAPTIMKKLGAIKTLLKRTSPDYSKIYMDNMKWLRKKYDNEFKGSWKKSALYI